MCLFFYYYYGNKSVELFLIVGWQSSWKVHLQCYSMNMHFMFNSWCDLTISLRFSMFFYIKFLFVESQVNPFYFTLKLITPSTNPCSDSTHTSHTRLHICFFIWKISYLFCNLSAIHLNKWILKSLTWKKYSLFMESSSKLRTSWSTLSCKLSMSVSLTCGQENYINNINANINEV